MGDFELGYRPRPIRLLDQQLTLDPEIVSMMAEIEARMAANRIINEMLRPDWRLMLPTFESMLNPAAPNIFATPTPPPAPSIWSAPRGSGPATPRAGELSDITGAVFQLPVVQGLVRQAHDEGLRQLRLFRSEWDGSSTGDRIVMVTMAGVVVGSSIAIIVANQETRDLAFGLIRDRDIPIPGVDGLSFRILDRGGSVRVPLGVPGLSGGARLQFPNSASPSYDVNISFDVMQFIRSRR
ncbi:MAG: hypothetical protein HOP17_04535 [Acidobacteria bacterium]|nr:hypothetical protein [Acidobacteriota bacterium]